QEYGVGEIVINSIDRDGTMTGYDISLVKEFYDVIHVPLTIMGGAGSFEDFKEALQNFDLVGLSAGSFFVFKGKYRAVLISYPDSDQKNQIFNDFIRKFY
ncbi:MAG: HisA/HisF-related TIM barrel protein, partial [Thermoplasmata archaeon]